MNPKVDWFFEKATQWQDEYAALRTIISESGLTEELKWGVPCYTLANQNVVLIHGFKEYCALLFHKGVLLKDKQKLLIQQTPNVQVARQMRFTSLGDILNHAEVIKSYIKEAVEVEKSGVKPTLKPTAEFHMPEEFERALTDMPELHKAFYALTPGRQRGYLLYFSQAKQAKTREARIEKYLPNILNGKGLED